MNKSEPKEYSKTIKNLKQKARKGNVLSMFQLYQNYSSGKHVEKVDDEQAQTYIVQTTKKLANAKFVVDSVALYQFRRFRQIKITFDQALTIIIGDNGAGKTSVVEAIAKTLTWFNNNLLKDSNGRPVTLADVNVNAEDYGEVTTHIRLDDGTDFGTVLVKSVPGSLGSNSSEVSDIKLAGLIYRHLANRKNIAIPLLAFYSVERSDFKLTQTIAEKAVSEISNNRFNSLDSALEGSGKLDDFSQHYIELVNLAEGETASEVKALRKKVTDLESLINEAYSGRELPVDDPVVETLNEKKLALEKALNKNVSIKHQQQLKFVNHAIETIVPEVNGFEVNRDFGKLMLMVNNFGNRVNISQLSQGQKTLVALTGDIARRLVTLNPVSINPLKGHGVVIIDEIELHLHPKWQQCVLSSFRQVFPNIQFIVTTHSPQVLSHIDRFNTKVIKLHDTKQDEVRETYGKNADRIYEDHMDVCSRPNEVQDKLDRLYKLIDQKKLDEAKSQINKLKEEIGEDGQLVKASTLIKRIEIIGR